MKAIFDVCAPAKLNLFLHVTGRRPDGYHLIESVFMLIDWCDVLHFELRPDGQLSRQDLSTSLPEHDLVLQAAHALKLASGTPLGAHISVDKRIPTQAGMGGGSSDAASTLLALNQLWGLNLHLSQLLEIGLRLGADVPFFLAGNNAWVGGIGEIMQPIELPPAYFLVAKPSQGLATARIFSDPDLKRNSKAAILCDFAANAFGYGQNDLQSVARRLCPAIKQTLDWFECMGLTGRMTGSGSAVFAPASHDFAASAAPSGLQFRLCHNLAVHPLRGWAA